MNPPRSIPEFLTQLQTTLQLESRLKDRIMTEVEDHLIETADRLRADGLPDEEAARMAILRFGTPKEVGLHFAGENIMETPLRSLTGRCPMG